MCTSDHEATDEHLATRPVRIAPSLLPAGDFARLADQVATIAPMVDLLHLDVMDGHFVPNLTFGPPVIQSLRPHTDLYFDCHLMMTNPGEFFAPLREAGANGVTIHVEIGETAHLLAEARSLGLDRGLALNPDTPAEAIFPYLDDVEMITIMTVVPGFGGQAFREDVLPKMREIAQRVNPAKVAIEVDGGVNVTTAPLARAAGADTFVGGNSILGADDPLEAIAELQSILRRTRS